MKDDKRDCGYPHRWEVYGKYVQQHHSISLTSVTVIRKCKVCHKIDKQVVRV